MYDSETLIYVRLNKRPTKKCVWTSLPFIYKRTALAAGVLEHMPPFSNHGNDHNVRGRVEQTAGHGPLVTGTADFLAGTNRHWHHKTWDKMQTEKYREISAVKQENNETGNFIAFLRENVSTLQEHVAQLDMLIAKNTEKQRVHTAKFEMFESEINNLIAEIQHLKSAGLPHESNTFV